MTPETAIALRAFRQLRISTGAWGLVFASVVASSAATYASTFPTVAEREQLAATTGRDAGVAILLGPISAIDTVAGYTVYKGFVTLTTLGAIWALLAATRLLRGEEESGRWQIVLAGATRPVRATLATLAGIGAAVLLLAVCTGAGAALAGRDPAVGFGWYDSLVYGASIAVPPAVFATVGAVTSQLARSRRGANGSGAVVLAACFLIRMIADSGPGTAWMLWCTPFGWTERMRPMTENFLAPLGLAAGVVAALTATAAVLAARRDLGSAAFGVRDAAPLRLFRPASPLGFAARLEFPALLGWVGGVAAAGFCFGVVAALATGSVPASMSGMLERFDVRGTFVQQYLGVCFLMLAAIVALLPVSQVGSFAEEETSGRLVNVLVTPSRRTAVFLGRMTIGAAATTLAGVAAGAFLWAGARLRGVHTGLAAELGAGCNLVPAALVVLGVAAVLRVVAPRRAAAATYGLVAGSFVVELVGTLLSGGRWLTYLSLFRYVSRAPAEPVEPGTVVIMLAVATALIGLATLLFARHDLQSV